LKDFSGSQPKLFYVTIHALLFGTEDNQDFLNEMPEFYTAVSMIKKRGLTEIEGLLGQ
jgi:hypothetical protein